MSPPIQDAFLDIVVMYMTLEIFSRNTDVIMMFLVLYGNHYCTENVQIIQFSVLGSFGYCRGKISSRAPVILAIVSE